MNDNYRRQPSHLCPAANTSLVLQRTADGAASDRPRRQQQVQLEADLAGCHLGGLPSPPDGPACRIRTVQPAPAELGDKPQATCRHQSQRSAPPRPQEPEQRGGRGRGAAVEQPAHSTLRSMFASLLGARQSRAKQSNAAAHQQRDQQTLSQCRDGDHYASQPRSKLSAASNHSAPAARLMSQPPEGNQICDTNPKGHQKQPAQQQQQHSKQALHVNFNRPGARQAAPPNGRRDSGPPGARDGDDDDENGDSCRKKKYLTAKYGQQQMNLIKKRLKVEMWLCERLKELAKGSKSEAELADVDIDLDQLLDLEDDASRLNWLKKTLEPFDDLPGERVDGFVREVLEQSRLL